MDAKLRKAAILVGTLDSDSAEELLALMGHEQSQRIRAAVIELTDVAAEERRNVAEEFLAQSGRRRPLDHPGIELDGALAAQFQYPATTFEAETMSAQPDRPPFRFLHEAAGDTLTRYLQQEHPQTIAVVLSHLPPGRAAEVVVRLDASLQVDVLRRIAELDQMDPEILQEVESGLHSLLADELNLVQRRSAGLAAVNAILRATGGKERTEVMTHIERHATPLAQKLQTVVSNSSGSARQRHADSHASRQTIRHVPVPTARAAPGPGPADSPPATIPMTKPRAATPTSPDPPPILFEDLVRLDDRGLMLLLQHADTNTMMLALTGATTELLERMLKQLPGREARKFRQQLETIGPLRLRDVEQAQEALARLASRLADEHQIQTPSPRGFAVAA